jgi:WD40 repeat protein
VISGPQRAVSYVKFLGGDHLVSASTDSTLRLWNLRQVVAAGGDVTSASSGSSRASGPRVAPACTFTGHRNQRNFVGLSVSPDGHILCGSEDNSGGWRGWMGAGRMCVRVFFK